MELGSFEMNAIGGFAGTTKRLDGLFDPLNVLGVGATTAADDLCTQFDPLRYVFFQWNAIFLAAPPANRNETSFKPSAKRGVRQMIRTHKPHRRPPHCLDRQSTGCDPSQTGRHLPI